MSTNAMDEKPPRRGAKGSPERRALLMDAALRVFDQRTIVDVTVEDIVQEAGVARGTFYIYFKDKYDILTALANRLNAQLFEASHLRSERHAPPFERIQTSLRAVLHAWTEHAGLYRSLTQMALSRPDFLELNQRNRSVFLRQIRSDIERSIERGHARPINPAVTAKALAAMMDWLCLLWFGLGEEPYPGATEDLDTVAEALARLWFRVIYASDPATGPGGDGHVAGASAERAGSTVAEAPDQASAAGDRTAQAH
ncbi:MAG TPA: TetR/AcrR family transcriptional regulator [Tepidiformaceae bacterium]|nr:TetR/AcrR family transcriptional regulator [Tepidiformaceae bacterium]